MASSGTSTTFRLSDTVSRSNAVEPADSLRVKRALRRLGHYRPPPWGITDFVDRGLFEGIAAFQKAEGLRSDGVMRPDGPTERRLGQALLAAGRQDRAVKSRRRAQDVALQKYGTGPLAPADVRLLTRHRGRDFEVLDEARKQHKRITDWSPDYRKEPKRSAALSNQRQLARAERNVRSMIRAGREAGLTQAADNLEHFLDGNYEKKTFTREQARQREFIREGEETNRQRFEIGFLEPRSSKPHADYRTRLLRLNDGESIRVPINPEQVRHKHRDHYDVLRKGRENLLSGDVDEFLATGTSTFKSAARNGFIATRRGSKILLAGVVTHKWHDVYDFASGDRSSEDALFLQQEGRGKPFVIEAVWHQRLTGDITLTGSEETGFELGIAKFQWEDLD